MGFCFYASFQYMLLLVESDGVNAFDPKLHFHAAGAP
jgi:hypothetical protein